jgi:hypothetical protein
MKSAKENNNFGIYIYTYNNTCASIQSIEAAEA